MKKFYLLLMILCFSISSFSQYNREIVGMWQQQNPSVSTYSNMMIFQEDGKFSNLITDISVNRQIELTEGVYYITGNNLIFSNSGGKLASKLLMISHNKMTIMVNGFVFIYARSNSSDDLFMYFLLNQ